MERSCATMRYLEGVGSPMSTLWLPSHSPFWKSSKVSQRRARNPTWLLMDSANNSTARQWSQWAASKPKGKLTNCRLNMKYPLYWRGYITVSRFVGSHAQKQHLLTGFRAMKIFWADQIIKIEDRLQRSRWHVGLSNLKNAVEGIRTRDPKAWAFLGLLGP